MSAFPSDIFQNPSIKALACLHAGLDGLSYAEIKKLQACADLSAADDSALRACGLSAAQAAGILSFLSDAKKMRRVEAEIATAILDGQVQSVTGALLQRLRDAPQAPLYLAANRRFDPDSLRVATVSIVGSRNASERALRWTKDLAAQLAEAGVLIVSGGAFGVDQAAHQGAIAAGGETLVVLGGSFAAEQLHLKSHFAPLWKHAQVISEQIRNEAIQPWMYPRRNRLVAALSDVVIVVEGRAKSGALITADYAQKMGRKIMAVPGWPEDRMAAAPNFLIATRRAQICRDVDDVLRALGRPVTPEQGAKARDKKTRQADLPDAQPSLFARDEAGRSPDADRRKKTKTDAAKNMAVTSSKKDSFSARLQSAGLGDVENRVLVFLHDHPGACHIDDISSAVDQSAAMLAGPLLQLEIRGFVESLAGACYAYRK